MSAAHSQNSEREKYEQMWRHDAYRAVAPGEHHVDKFLELARVRQHHTVCDFGCGTGRGAARIGFLSGAAVTAIDFADNALDPDVRGHLSERFRFVQHDLSSPLSERFDFGYCTDVLEHIPTDQVDTVLTNIGLAARHVYLAISTVDDVMGALVGEPLHLTVRDPYWWHDKLTDLGFRIDWSFDAGNAVCFYCSGYMNADDIMDVAVLNMEEETVKANIRANLDFGLKEIEPHQAQPDTTVYLLAGGPSLADFEEQIVRDGRNGQLIVTVNGTYNWLLDRGIRPAAQIMVDGRTFNRRFVERAVDTCKYLISSQCDNELVRSLPREQTLLWHSAATPVVQSVLEERNYSGYPVHGGTTVVTRALVLLAMLGFRNVEVFGFDSCLRGDAHHAYAQPENDNERVLEVSVGNRIFKCSGWMVIQAEDFQKTVRHILGQIPDFNLVVHGDGLIAHIINFAALNAVSTQES